MADILHRDARCRWCGGPFKLVHGYQWICTSAPCAERCMDLATKREGAPPAGQELSPFLFLPLPMQVEIEESSTRRLLAHGPAGISKSYGGRWLIYRHCLRFEGVQWLLLRCTVMQLRNNHLKFIDHEIRELARYCAKAAGVKYTKQPDHVVSFPEMGSSITMGYCDNAGQIGQHKGPEWDGILFEQAEEFLPEALSLIASRDRASPTGMRSMIAHFGSRRGRTVLLANAGGQAAQFLDDQYITRKPDPEEYPAYDASEFGSIVGDVEDNPYLEEGHRTKSLGGLNKTLYAQLANNDRTVFEGQFFPQFSRDVHVVSTEVE